MLWKKELEVGELKKKRKLNKDFYDTFSILNKNNKSKSKLKLKSKRQNMYKSKSSININKIKLKKATESKQNRVLKPKQLKQMKKSITVK
mmetsp:Transcript_6007/g.5176  ORF Transcript_6007/g.5176 Transcript_6007/m.5176 type:complete len:90 (+) Transcript_6007:288-557(+)